MLARNSALRQLPPGLDRRQALFFDGIRHAAEITDFAYSRLKVTLTQIAIDQPVEAEADSAFTSAFLDAWAVVDAIDRFRTLWRLMPISGRKQASDGEHTFSSVSEPIRSLRNVADHLAQRADYVISHKGAALGSLSWFTLLDRERMTGVCCAIVPGTIQTARARLVNPAGKLLEFPTGAVTLHAGEHVACLSDVIREMEIRVRDLENGLEAEFKRLGVRESHAGADLLVVAEVSFGDTEGKAPATR